MAVHFAIHLLKDLPKSNCSLASTPLPNNQANLERVQKPADHATQTPQDSMDEPHDRESLRKTMLQQEKIFHEQVLELHRLYLVQRALMSEFTKETTAGSATVDSGGGAASDAKSSGPWSSTSDSWTTLSSALTDRTTNPAQLNPCKGFSMENGVVVPCSWAAPSPGFEEAVPAPPVQDRPRDGATGKSEDNGLDLTLRIGSTPGKEKVRKVAKMDLLDLEPAESTSNDVKRAVTLNNHSMPLPSKEHAHAHASLFINFSSPGLQCPPWLLHAL